MDYILDTNILVVYIRDNDVSKAIEEDLELFNDNNRLVISAVSVAEIKSIAMQNKWGGKKIKKLDEILESFIIVHDITGEMITAYTEIDAYSQGRHPSVGSSHSSKNMGKNDLWIAATAKVYDCTLICKSQDKF